MVHGLFRIISMRFRLVRAEAAGAGLLALGGYVVLVGDRLQSPSSTSRSPK
jgi:hypothetical protein